VPAALFLCASLRTLCLSVNALHDLSPHPWSALAALETLDVCDNRLTRLGDVAVMTWLRHLNLANNAVSAL
jgi:Leucine-rich repeat (LRR) protein